MITPPLSKIHRLAIQHLKWHNFIRNKPVLNPQGLLKKKSRIQGTLNLSTDADSSTDTMGGGAQLIYIFC